MVEASGSFRGLARSGVAKEVIIGSIVEKKCERVAWVLEKAKRNDIAERIKNVESGEEQK